jgi:hypothetical protein
MTLLPSSISLPLFCFQLNPSFLPFYCTDEANALTLWKRKDAVALKQFLEFLKRSCKEEHTVHVVLATSEFFLVSWLESSKCFPFHYHKYQ